MKSAEGSLIAAMLRSGSMLGFSVKIICYSIVTNRTNKHELPNIGRYNRHVDYLFSIHSSSITIIGGLLLSH